MTRRRWQRSQFSLPTRPQAWATRRTWCRGMNCSVPALDSDGPEIRRNLANCAITPQEQSFITVDPTPAPCAVLCRPEGALLMVPGVALTRPDQNVVIVMSSSNGRRGGGGRVVVGVRPTGRGGGGWVGGNEGVECVPAMGVSLLALDSSLIFPQRTILVLGWVVWPGGGGGVRHHPPPAPPPWISTSLWGGGLPRASLESLKTKGGGTPPPKPPPPLPRPK